MEERTEEKIYAICGNCDKNIYTYQSYLDKNKIYKWFHTDTKDALCHFPYKYIEIAVLAVPKEKEENEWW